MSNLEIIIPNPRKHFMGKEFRRFNYGDKREVQRFYDVLDKEGITPVTYPLVADLAAGDGSYAKMLMDRGWDLGGVTCIDFLCSPKPLITGCNWLYWNLEELDSALRQSAHLPQEITAHAESFDLVVFQGTHLIEERICDFLVKPGGYSYHHSWLYRKEG